MADGKLAAAFAAVAIAAGAPISASAGQGSPPALERFTVPSDGHPMAVWARRPASPSAAVLLVHGRTWSSRPDFDLQVPGMARSVMLSLAGRGLAAYAVDLRGYGETPRDATGWLTPRRAAADVLTVVAWMARQHPGLPPPSIAGWSRGAAVAMLAAQSAPERVSALVLFGFAFDPDLDFVDVPMPEKPAMLRNTAESAASDFISPAVTPPAVVRAFVEQAVRADPVLADLRGDAELNALAPERLTVPTLILFGDRDPGVAPDHARRLLDRLASAQKRLVVLRGADHAAHLEDTHGAWIDAVASFALRSPR